MYEGQRLTLGNVLSTRSNLHSDLELLSILSGTPLVTIYGCESALLYATSLTTSRSPAAHLLAPQQLAVNLKAS